MNINTIITIFAVVASFGAVSGQSPWSAAGFDKKSDWKKYKRNYNKAVKKGWPLPPKPAPKPVTKPPPTKSWPSPCEKTYEVLFSDIGGKYVGAGGGSATMTAKGDYKVFSGDIWSDDAGYKRGFLQALSFRMSPIKGDSTELFLATIQDNGYGQLLFSGYVRLDASILPKDEDRAKGPIVTLAITGGTDKYKGASGEVECSVFRLNKGDSKLYFHFKVMPHCPVYPPKKNYPAWP